MLAGSTLAELAPQPAEALLRRIARLAGPDALLVVGTEASRDPAVLLSPCDDHHDTPTSPDLDLLVRINRELGADFDLGGFAREARFAADPARIEMHLVSRRAQQVWLLGQRFDLGAGESIHTATVNRYCITGLQGLARRAGWDPRQLWTDARARFAVHVLLSIG